MQSPWLVVESERGMQAQVCYIVLNFESDVEMPGVSTNQTETRPERLSLGTRGGFLLGVKRVGVGFCFGDTCPLLKDGILYNTNIIIVNTKQ